jgi:hypothetical protein
LRPDCGRDLHQRVKKGETDNDGLNEIENGEKLVVAFVSRNCSDRLANEIK